MLFIFNSPSQVTQCMIRSYPAPLSLNNSRFLGGVHLYLKLFFSSISTILDFFAWEEKTSATDSHSF